MAPDSNITTTSIDSLINLLKRSGRMELSKAAVELGVPEAVCENWAKILESGNILKVTNLMGRMYIEPMEGGEAQFKAAPTEETAENILNVFENEVVTQKAVLDKYEAEIARMNAAAGSAEGAFRQKYPLLEQHLDSLNRIYTALEAENAKVDAIKKRMDDSYAAVNAKMDAFSRRIDATLPGAVQKVKDESDRIDQMRKNANSIENQLDILMKSKDKALETISNSMRDEFKALEKQFNEAKASIDKEAKLYRDQVEREAAGVKAEDAKVKELARGMQGFSSEAVAWRQEMKKSLAAFEDEYARTTIRAKGTSDTLKAQIKEIMGEMDRIKSDFGRAGEMYDSMLKAKADVYAVGKSIAALKEDAAALEKEIREMRASKKGSLSSAISGIEQKVKQFDDSVAKAGKGVAAGGAKPGQNGNGNAQK